MLFDYDFRNYNFRLLLYMAALSLIGILAISSASGADSSRMIKQIGGVVLAFVICIAISMLDYHRYEQFAAAIYIVCSLMLGAVLIMGISTKGATRWLKIGPIQIQPSEFVKIGLILVIAIYLSRNVDTLNQPRTLARTAGIAGIPLAMVFLQPNLSTTIVISVMILCMVFAAGLSYRWIWGTVLVGLPAFGILLWAALQDLVPFLKQYQAQRIMARFFNTSGDYTDLNRQQNNSIMAIGSGRLTGKGLFNEALGSVKNGNFLSEEQTDFIFAIIGEEMGFAGCVVVISLYALLVFECLFIASRARDLEGKLICTGVASLLAFQSFANIAVATGIFPNTGLPLPFISSGISSLLSTFVGMGIVLNIGMQRASAA